MIEKSFAALPDAPRSVPVPAEHRLCPGAGASLLLDGFRLVGVAADVPARGGRHAIVAGRELAIFNVGDRFVAVDRGCYHDHLDPFHGEVVDGHLTCPDHRWSIDSWSGADADGGPPVRMHDALVRDGLLYVRLAADLDV
ncbi:Rieske 2Fe-2S domain-containing protein [Patulibacter sp. NPDC049589]|uniref:Rieske (2Fe-2S) protein n=1 Tax=Patulibacter sp. NPDC049589 TaxID=3154731 RepID=UPI0034259807